jgi:uncharacterized protein (TIGR03435 family)
MRVNMNRILPCAISCISGLLFAQSEQPSRFEVASIRPSQADPHSSGISTGSGRLTATNVTLKRCIMGAYGVGPNQIFGGPDWLDADRFNITAKAEQPVGDHALMQMLRMLLTERFKLAFHRDTRPIEAYVLEVAKNGPKLEKSGGGGATTSNGRGDIVVTNTTMDRFAEVLSRQMDLPVVNRTGLEGVFNLRLRWTPDTGKPPTDAGTASEGTSVFTAIQEQLGLRLRGQKVPIEVLVIDHAEKPSEN